VVLLHRPVMLVSGQEVEVQRDSLPLHVLGGVDEASRAAVARLLGSDPALGSLYGAWLSLYEPALWQEVVRMAAEHGRTLTPDLRPLIEQVGEQEVIRQWGLKRILEVAGVKKALEEVGLKRALEEVGTSRVVQEIGVDEMLAGMTPEQRQEMLRKLQQEAGS
jgi:hypothetical protein